MPASITRQLVVITAGVSNNQLERLPVATGRNSTDFTPSSLVDITRLDRKTCYRTAKWRRRGIIRINHGPSSRHRRRRSVIRQDGLEPFDDSSDERRGPGDSGLKRQKEVTILPDVSAGIVMVVVKQTCSASDTDVHLS